MQHYKSLTQRFENFGVKVAKLDRFTSPREKAQILKALSEGKLDVCVGTHALLGVSCQNLALLVIDEEHKFGVKQKEKLKNMRENIHILSMSATPIPRSLNMALSSIKQYSQILTPPSEREDVRSFVKEYDEKIIKEVVSRELRRGGQVFYVHNKIATIEEKKKELGLLMPNLRVLVLHSQVSENVTEDEMIKFDNKEYDMLLSTSIIESGIHLPNVNTIIIESADHFGMADLHQLRGRVGRGKNQGFCYFLVKSKELLSDSGKKRLIALESNSFLGSGSVLAYHDLEIRGGGNLIGEAQSGHIKHIGYSLYLKMLEDTISELLNKTPLKRSDVEIKLSISAYLGSELISEDRLRLELYRRLSKCESVKEVYEIEEEIEDRFGKLDTPTSQFLSLIIMKILASHLKIKNISNYKENISINDENEQKTYLKSPSFDDDDIITTTLGYLRSKVKSSSSS
jgi:transcription-repair coupling factor (superfamily II helicase)